MTLSALSGGSLHSATSVRVHQLIHVDVEWILGDPEASTIQPSTLVVRTGGRVVFRGWLNVLYPHSVADFVLESSKDRGRATVAVTLGDVSCAASASKALHVRTGTPPRTPWVYPDCVPTYTASGAACWLIAGGFKAHEAISVTYRLQPATGPSVRGGLRGQADGHGVFGSIALDLGSDVSWKTAVLRVVVKAGRRGPVRSVVHLAR